jgi:hypothetical protein
MSPLQARRLVGQPDIVERLRAQSWSPDTKANRDQAALERDAVAEIERLRTALRAVRACTDPAWAAQIISDALRETP